MTLKGLPNVLDIRPIGLVCGIDLGSRPDAVGRRGYDAMVKAFHDENLMVRAVGDTLALTPPLIISEGEIGEIFAKVGKVIRAVA
jgi:beta-alanine--pyruvate transaminase